jgi:hypothetical protein
VRSAASDGFDAARRRMLVFGGATETGPLNDTWSLDLGLTPEWSPIETAGTPPSGRYYHVSIFDAPRDQLLVYGGSPSDVYERPRGDLWALSFSSATPTWSPIVPFGPAPPARDLATLVHDSRRDRYLLFFGQAGPIDLLNDVWEMRLTPAPAWRRLSPSGVAPSPRAGVMGAYDAARDRVVLFGGLNGSVPLAHVWTLNLASGDGVWEQMPTPLGAPPRAMGLMRFDSARQRLIVFGGWGLIPYGPGQYLLTELNDTWALSLDAVPEWSAIQPEGVLPPARNRMNGAYDPLHDRLIIACGMTDGANDTWELDLGDVSTPVLVALARAEARFDRVRLGWVSNRPGWRATVQRRAAGGAWQAIAELSADGEGRFDYEDRDVAAGMVLEYRLAIREGDAENFFGFARVTVPASPGALALAASASAGRATLRFELASDAPASLALFDVGGRRLWSRDVGGLGAGTHELRIDEALSPALYFARLVQGEESRAARLVTWR